MTFEGKEVRWAAGFEKKSSQGRVRNRDGVLGWGEGRAANRVYKSEDGSPKGKGPERKG